MFQNIRRVIPSADQAGKLYVLYTAGHDVTAKDEMVICHTAAQDAASLDFDHFAVVLILLFVNIAIPFLSLIHI